MAIYSGFTQRVSEGIKALPVESTVFTDQIWLTHLNLEDHRVQEQLVPILCFIPDIFHKG